MCKKEKYLFAKVLPKKSILAFLALSWANPLHTKPISFCRYIGEFTWTYSLGFFIIICNNYKFFLVFAKVLLKRSFLATLATPSLGLPPWYQNLLFFTYIGEHIWQYSFGCFYNYMWQLENNILGFCQNFAKKVIFCQFSTTCWK